MDGSGMDWQREAGGERTGEDWSGAERMGMDRKRRSGWEGIGSGWDRHGWARKG